METVPLFLDLPAKLMPMTDSFNEHRYFLLEGGRASGKSQSVARFLLYLAAKYKLRIVCAREVQVNIAESSYTLLCDLIQKYNLDFDISATKIVSRETNSVISFRGFREQNRFSIQGLEAIDICWVDEAQAITKDTLDVLVPTIRGENSKIIFTMNRFMPNDAVFAVFSTRSDCLHIHADYLDNQHCPLAIKREAEECLKRSPKDYDHIWLGMPSDQSEDMLYSLHELLQSKNTSFESQLGYGIRVMGVDIARFGTDSNAVVILQQMDALHWEEIYCADWQQRDLNFTTGKIHEIANRYNVDRCAIDEDGMGAGPVDTLTRGRNLEYFTGFRNFSISQEHNKDFGNNRTVAAYKLKDLLQKSHIALKDEALISELQMIRYEFKSDQRRILVSKDKMRKDGVQSPNKADALFYAVSLIGEVKERQEQRYESQQPSYGAPEEDLFKIAGV